MASQLCRAQNALPPAETWRSPSGAPHPPAGLASFVVAQHKDMRVVFAILHVFRGCSRASSLTTSAGYNRRNVMLDWVMAISCCLNHSLWGIVSTEPWDWLAGSARTEPVAKKLSFALLRATCRQCQASNGAKKMRVLISKSFLRANVTLVAPHLQCLLDVLNPTAKARTALSSNALANCASDP